METHTPGHMLMAGRVRLPWNVLARLVQRTLGSSDVRGFSDLWVAFLFFFVFFWVAVGEGGNGLGLSASDSKNRSLESLWRHSISFHISWLTDLCYLIMWLLEASVSSHWKWRLRGVQRLEFRAFAPGGLDLISVRGTKIQQAVWHVQKKMEIVVVPTP